MNALFVAPTSNAALIRRIRIDTTDFPIVTLHFGIGMEFIVLPTGRHRIKATKSSQPLFKRTVASILASPEPKNKE